MTRVQLSPSGSTLRLDPGPAESRADIAARNDARRLPHYNCREKRIEKFIARQRDLDRKGDPAAWISFACLANELGRAGGTRLRPDARLRCDAFGTLLQALIDRAFDVRGKSQVMYLHPTAPWVRMTPAEARALPGFSGDPHSPAARQAIETLSRCWVRRGLLPAWLAGTAPGEPRTPNRPIFCGGHPRLPSDAWIQAHHAFSWMAFGGSTAIDEILAELKSTVAAAGGHPWGALDFHDFRDYRRAFNVLDDRIAMLSTARDRVVSLLRAEKLYAYVRLADGIDMRPVPSWAFTEGLTINIFHGDICRSHDSLDIGRPTYERLKAASLTGMVLFRWEELMSAMRSDRTEDGASPAGDDGPPEYRPAPESVIHATITAVYDSADENKMKSPNVKEIVRPVQSRLRQTGVTASFIRITEFAGLAMHKARRRSPGPRVNGTLLPFSDH